MLAMNATCKLVVTFTPTGSATLFGQVRVAYSDGVATRTAVRAVSGTPTAQAHVTVAEFFGPNNLQQLLAVRLRQRRRPARHVEHVFTVYNTGALAATSLAPMAGLNAPFAYKSPGGYPGSGGTCGSTLVAGTSCQLVVVFAPQSAGTASSTLAVSYTDTSMAPMTACGRSPAARSESPTHLATSERAWFTMNARCRMRIALALSLSRRAVDRL